MPARTAPSRSRGPATAGRRRPPMRAHDGCATSPMAARRVELPSQYRSRARRLQSQIQRTLMRCSQARCQPPDPHAPDDERFSASPIRERPGGDLHDAPRGGIDGSQQSNLREVQPATANTSGKSPHAMPSFRLFTRPAWLTLDRVWILQSYARTPRGPRERCQPRAPPCRRA